MIQSLEPDNLEAVYLLIRDASIADWTPRVSHAALRGVEPSRTALLIEAGKPVAFIWWRAEPGAFAFQGWVHPDLRGRGYGTQLLSAVEAAADREGAQVLRSVITSDTPNVATLFEAHGYEITRVYDQMWATLTGRDFGALPAPPTGITIRNYQPEDVAELAAAENDAFRDDWATPYTPESMAAALAEDFDFDPRRYWLVLDGGTIAAFVLSKTSPLNGRPDDGWVWHVGTRHAYHRRGLARLLLRYALLRLQEQRFQRVGLHVLEENAPAIRLYESLGFQKLRQRVHVIKKIR